MEDTTELDNLNIEDVLISMRSKAAEIKELKKENEEIKSQQVNVLNAHLQKLKPVFELIVSSGYYFRHPTLKYMSARGPVVGYDNKEDRVLVYDISQNAIKKVRVNGDKSGESSLNLMDIVSLHSFTEALVGLKCVLELYDDIIEGYRNNTQKRLMELSSN